MGFESPAIFGQNFVIFCPQQEFMFAIHKTYKATKKGNLVEHQRRVHEGVKYPCGICDYQATAKRNLTEHQRGVHE